jgi:hypothetical protein
VAQASSSAEAVVPAAAQDANALIRAIHTAGTKGDGRTPTAVRREKNVFEVAYTARPGHLSKYGVYTMTVIVNPGGPEILVMAHPTRHAWRPWTALPAESESYRFDFGVEKQAAGLHLTYRHAHWIYTTEELPPESAGEAELTGPDLEAFYKRVVGVIKEAEHHDPISEQQNLHPGLP